ncbi:MMPL family transporter [Actinoplanes sp. NPDC026619]|uniref:MMPL family transporter n=1 Tax=Actinoplanes sp. NPDC026619 TaxID=3155798 RepID=UPI003409E7F5
MFAGWGSWVARFRWPVLSVALVAVVGAGIWGLGLFSQLTEGGYIDPNSESSHASDAITSAFGAQGGDLVVIYTPTKGKIDDAALGTAVKDSLAALPKSAVTGSSSYWSAKSATYAAKDKSSAVALITLAGDDDATKLDSYREIDDKFAVAGAKVQLSGGVVLSDASSARSTKDLGKAEAISVPITLILLVFIFGSLVAASLPVLVGGASVLGSLGILHAVAGFHDVNSFAVNVASLLGLGMAIDYGLFMVGRFREEQNDGRTPSEAVARAVGTAGRTVVFSATMLMIALSGLLLFPQGFLKSLAYGGLAAVFLAAFLSLTLLPALLAVLGKRVDKLPVRLPGRKNAGEPGSGWTKLAGFVLRRPLLVAVPILVVLLLLAAPVRNVKFGDSDERMLPAGDSARVAIETLKSDYPQFTGDSVEIVLRGASDTAAFAVALRQIPGIAQLGVPRKADRVAVFTATLDTKDAYSDEARDVVDAIRAVPVPAGATLLVGGTTARNVDSLEATGNRLPYMVGLLVGATLLLMFLAFGSILLPIKAVLMSALSLSATFGALVWIFQEGHGSGLLDVTPAPLEVGIVVLMAAVVFGLSTDYEVFLLSRMVEARTRGATTDEAVTIGLARTGRVISAAALLLIVVTGAFAMSAVTTMRFVGVGMIIALLLDATVVRMLLVPAVLRLLGDAAWWAPGPLRRLQQRAGLAEYEVEPSPAGRHALSDDTQVLTYRPNAFALPAASPDFPWADEVSGEIVGGRALPAPDAPFALPAAGNDATQVFSRFEETQVLSLPAAPDATVVADEEPVDAEIVEAESLFAQPEAPVLPEFDPAVTATRLAELSGFLPAVPRYDAPAPRPTDDSFFFAPPSSAGPGPLALPAGLSRHDDSRPGDRPAASIPVVPGMSLPVDPDVPEPPAYADSPASDDFPTATESISATDLSATAPAPATPLPEFIPLAESDAEPVAEAAVTREPEVAGAPAAGPPSATDAPAPMTTTAEPATSFEAEPAANASGGRHGTSGEPELDVLAPASADADLATHLGDAPAPEADPSHAPASSADPRYVTPTEREPAPAASAEAQSADPRYVTAAEPATSAMVRPVGSAEPEPALAGAAALRGDQETASAEDDARIATDEAEADNPAEIETPSSDDDLYAPAAHSSAGGEPPLDEEFYARAAATLFGPDPAEPDYAYAPSAHAEAGPTVDLSTRIGSGRPATLADQQPARRSPHRPNDQAAYTKDGQTPSRRPASLGDQLLPRRPIPSIPEPQPMTEPQQSPAAEPVLRRPADLADHLRESRPADLSDYTAGRIPRTRRPADDDPSGLPAPTGEPAAVPATGGPSGSSGGGGPLAAPRRPATLADHLSRRKADEAAPGREAGEQGQ